MGTGPQGKDLPADTSCRGSIPQGQPPALGEGGAEKLVHISPWSL